MGQKISPEQSRNASTELTKGLKPDTENALPYGWDKHDDEGRLRKTRRIWAWRRRMDRRRRLGRRRRRTRRWRWATGQPGF